MNTRVAKIAQAKVQPAFSVTKLEGKRKRKILSIVDGEREEKTVEEPAGYMVRTLRGDEIHVPNDKELRRLGFDEGNTVELHDVTKDDLIDPVDYATNEVNRSKK